MKTSIYSMKQSLKTLTMVMLAATFLLTSCEKGDTGTPGMEAAITDEEAVALVEGAMAVEAEGMTAELNAAIAVTEPMLQKSPTNPYCGIGNDSTVTHTFNSARFDGNLSTNWQWMLNCDENDLPLSLTYGRTGEISYESLRLVSNDVAEGSWAMTNLVGGTEYLFNGSYERVGTQESKVRNERSFESTVKFDLTDLAVGKLKRKINSGTANFTISGEASTGETYSLSGSITFLGDGAAEVVINGIAYPIDLY